MKNCNKKVLIYIRYIPKPVDLKKPQEKSKSTGCC